MTQQAEILGVEGEELVVDSFLRPYLGNEISIPQVPETQLSFLFF